MTTYAPRPSPMPGVPAHGQRRLWLITFVDLVMLLLAFFVLLFSMSTLNGARYAAIARSYADVFRGVGGVNETSIGPLRVPEIPRVPGDDLAYLETVLRTKFAPDERLSAIQLRLTSQYLILSVPAPTTAGADSFDGETQSRFFDLGGVLSNLPNRIAIVAPATAGDNATAWSAADARARLVQSALGAAGYTRDLTHFVQGSVAADEVGEQPIQIIIFPERNAGEVPP